MKKKKLPTLSSLENKLDRVFSEYIRRSYADEGGTVECVTCRKLLYWKEADCGHWVKRQHRSVRWDPRNCAPQCTRCNHFMGGVQDEFSLHIIAEHGMDAYRELLKKKHEVCKHTRSDLEEMIARYKSKLEGLEGD